MQIDEKALEHTLGFIKNPETAQLVRHAIASYEDAKSAGHDECSYCAGWPCTRDDKCRLKRETEKADELSLEEKAISVKAYFDSPDSYSKEEYDFVVQNANELWQDLRNTPKRETEQPVDGAEALLLFCETHQNLMPEGSLRFVEMAWNAALATKREVITQLSDCERVVRQYRRISSAAGDKAWKEYQAKYTGIENGE